MQLRWTEQAADDLEAITDYLFANAPEHAERIVRTCHTYRCLLRFPIAIAISCSRKDIDLHKPHDARQLSGVSNPASEA